MGLVRRILFRSIPLRNSAYLCARRCNKEKALFGYPRAKVREGTQSKRLEEYKTFSKTVFVYDREYFIESDFGFRLSLEPEERDPPHSEQTLNPYLCVPPRTFARDLSIDMAGGRT